MSMRTAVVWMRLEKSGGARNGVLLVRPAAIGPLPKHALARTLRASRRDDTRRALNMPCTGGIEELLEYFDAPANCSVSAKFGNPGDQ